MTPYTASMIFLFVLVLLVNVNDVTRARRIKKKYARPESTIARKQ